MAADHETSLKLLKFNELQKKAEASEAEQAVTAPSPATSGIVRTEAAPASDAAKPSQVDVGEEEAKKKKKSRKPRRTVHERRYEQTMKELVAFLPRAKRPEALKFLNTVLAEHNDIKLHKNEIMHGRVKKGHVTAVLARKYLPEKEPNEDFFSSLLTSVSPLKPNFSHTFEV